MHFTQMDKYMKKTRDKIIKAARDVFIQKGFAAARTQEIADRAKINKGLLHYYFKSKENLHHAVVNELISDMIPQLDMLFTSDEKLEVKIKQFVNLYIDFLIKNPFIPPFIISELNMRGEKFPLELMNKYKVNPMKLLFQIEYETREGLIRPVNPLQLIMNTLSLCVFPFVARPVFKTLMKINDKEFLQLMEYRKEEVSDFILSSIKI